MHNTLNRLIAAGIFMWVVISLTTALPILQYKTYGTIDWGDAADYTVATMNAGGNIVALRHANFSGAGQFQFMLADKGAFEFATFGCDDVYGLTNYGLSLLYDLEHGTAYFYTVIPNALVLYSIRAGNYVCTSLTFPKNEENFCRVHCAGYDISSCIPSTSIPNGRIVALPGPEEIGYLIDYHMNIAAISVHTDTYSNFTRTIDYQLIVASKPSLCAATYGHGFWQLSRLAVKNVSYECNTTEEAIAVCIGPGMYRCADGVVRLSCIQRWNCQHGYYDYFNEQCVCPSSYDGNECEITKCLPVCINGYCRSTNTCVCPANNTAGFYGPACEHVLITDSTPHTEIAEDIIVDATSNILFNLSTASANRGLLVINGTLTVGNNSVIHVAIIGDYPAADTWFKLFSANHIIWPANVTTLLEPIVAANCTPPQIFYNSTTLSVYYNTSCATTVVFLPPDIAIGSAIFSVIICSIIALLARYSRLFRRYAFPFKCVRRQTRRNLSLMADTELRRLVHS